MSNICCYLLTSESTENTYVGYTTDIGNRLLAHNGEKSGGALATHMNRPWKIKMLVTGFTSQRQARQLEFQWKRSSKSRHFPAREKRIHELLLTDKFENLILHEY